MKLPELLAPAGSPEAALAALKGGADAIYLGGRMLNARMNANNFTDDQLSECIKTCHARGVKVYVTLNTSVYDRELADAIKYADTLYEMGTDALIIADLGFVALTKGRYPNMEFHASTQASGHSKENAAELKKAARGRKKFSYCPDLFPTGECWVFVTECGEELVLKLYADEAMLRMLKRGVE
jgi:putative protease